jgi:hypothetical protein
MGILSPMFHSTFFVALRREVLNMSFVVCYDWEKQNMTNWLGSRKWDWRDLTPRDL